MSNAARYWIFFLCFSRRVPTHTILTPTPLPSPSKLLIKRARAHNSYNNIIIENSENVLSPSCTVASGFLQAPSCIAIKVWGAWKYFMRFLLNIIQWCGGVIIMEQWLLVLKNFWRIFGWFPCNKIPSHLGDYYNIISYKIEIYYTTRIIHTCLT